MFASGKHQHACTRPRSAPEHRPCQADDWVAHACLLQLLSHLTTEELPRCTICYRLMHLGS